MFTVALIGPDGAGKTTIGQMLSDDLPLPVTYLYMGVSADSSNRLLPTTRLWRRIKRALGARPDNHGPRERGAAAPRRGLLRRLASNAKSLAGLANRLSEEWYRQLLAGYYKRRRRIVLFDRHYLPDYYAYDVAADQQPRSLARRIHGFCLKYLYPRPDLFVYLDAPAEVLLSRKGEGTLELLETRRQDYLQFGASVPDFAVVDANRSLGVVVQEVRELIWNYYGRRFPDAALSSGGVAKCAASSPQRMS
jgi:thymidylate kinase